MAKQDKFVRELLTNKRSNPLLMEAPWAVVDFSCGRALGLDLYGVAEARSALSTLFDGPVL